MKKENLYCTFIEVQENKILLSGLASLPTSFSFNVGWKDVDAEIALGMKITIQEAHKIRIGKVKLKNAAKQHLFEEILCYRCADLFGLIKKYLDKRKYKPSVTILFGVPYQTKAIIEVARKTFKIPVYISPVEH